MLILKAVSLGPLHGYGILLRIQQISKNRLGIQQGSLYPALTARAAGVIRDIDRDLPIFNVRTQAAQIDATIARERLFVMLTLAFGGLALVLAAIGIYGTVAHSVARRTSEIGIRLALGADRRNVRLMVLREASATAVVGAAIGLVVSAALTRWVQAMLFGVTPLDPLALSAAVTTMLAVAVLAGWLPTRRASMLDPVGALRHE
jgi:ABC-type antimicrobial peptide transport system permease subunit